jgi:hypothetical protein
MPNHYEYAVMANEVYKPDGGIPPHGWELFDIYSDPTMFFQVAAYRNTQTLEVVIAFRGTDGWRNWIFDNSGLILGQHLGSINQALLFLNGISNHHEHTNGDGQSNYRIYVTGHSLGAAIAEIIAWRHRDVLEAVTFESPGTNAHTLEHNPHPANNNLRMVTYLTTPNIVNTLNKHTCLNNNFENGEAYRLHIPHINPGSYPDFGYTTSCVWNTGWQAWNIVTIGTLAAASIGVKSALKVSGKVVSQKAAKVTTKIAARSFAQKSGEFAGKHSYKFLADKSVATVLPSVVGALPGFFPDYYSVEQHSMSIIVDCFHYTGETRDERYKRNIISWPHQGFESAVHFLKKTGNFIKGELTDALPTPWNRNIFNVFRENYIKEVEIRNMIGYEVEGNIISWNSRDIIQNNEEILYIMGFVLQDVSRGGNSFYRALSDQMQQINYDTNTDPQTLRNIMQPGTVETNQVLEVNAPNLFITAFPRLILAIIKTYNSAEGFVCYYNNNGNLLINTTGRNLPLDKPIIKLVSTGGHWLSVRSHIELTSGAIRGAMQEENAQSFESDDSDDNDSDVDDYGVFLCIDASIYDPNYHKPFEKLAVNLQLIAAEVSNNVIFSVHYLMESIYGKNDNSNNHPTPLMIEDEPHIKPQSNEKISINFNDLLYKSTISFKSFDFIVNIFRFINEPSAENVQKTLRDVVHLQNIFAGSNIYSIALSFINIKNQLYQGEVQEAGIQAITTIGYMALPTALAFTGVPYLGFAYGAMMAGFTGYHAVNNARSLYSEYGTVEWQLKSAVAYKGLYEILANSPLQHTYDFTSNAKQHEIKANSIKLEVEKSQIKQHLEAKGEFGNKLYDYIHAPTLEEKYNLLNKIISGELTEAQAAALKTKHIAMTIGIQHYEHCIEVKNNMTIVTAEEYYCYNENQQILDHVLVGDNGIVESIERL